MTTPQIIFVVISIGRRIKSMMAKMMRTKARTPRILTVRMDPPTKPAKLSQAVKIRELKRRVRRASLFWGMRTICN